MKFFDELGNEILQRWSDRTWDAESFPEIATRALIDRPPAEYVTYPEVLDWVRTAPVLPPQHDPDATFGEPPVCLFWSPRFFIQALFWLDGTTSIHQHRFSGAFHVMSGSSLHSRFAFTSEENLGQRYVVGQVRHGETELLTRGSTRAIVQGASFIHSLFHLDRPSVTIVVRTFGGSATGPQYEYLAPALARDPFAAEDHVKRVVQTLALLKEIDDEGHRRALHAAARSSDFSLVFGALEHAAGASVGSETLGELVDAAKQRHGERAAVLKAVLEERCRQLAVVRRRRLVTHPEHRFFLALLLNLPSRHLVLDLVRRRHGDEEPVAVILRWVREIAALPSGDGIGPNPLGFQLSDTEMDVFGHLLRGKADDALLEALRSEYEDPTVFGQEIGQLCNALRASPLLRPLFTEQ